jgi:para-aminobenzoate synthetase component 1
MSDKTETTIGWVLLEEGPAGGPVLFAHPLRVMQAKTGAEVPGLLAELDAERAKGRWIAGYLSYEAGYALEPKLAALEPLGGGPRAVFGVFDAPQDASALLAEAKDQARGVAIAATEPMISRAAYDAAMAKVMGYIGAGDCYQINLTFPMQTRLLAGTALGLYGALRARQAVGRGAFVDLGIGPVLVSRSPELFISLTAAGRIEARPMKGTAPRDPDPVQDAELAAELRASEKGQAENLMIVDLLRNDISRVAKVGSVKVPKLFAVESYATVHQMVSTVVGDLVETPSMAGVMAALFPCGSITGAPKIRAMEIIHEVEAHPRGAYCGAIGWMAPDGAASFNVAIRTLSLTGDQIVLNVGGGVVQDSTADGEWEEALWKARYVQGLVSRG